MLVLILIFATFHSGMASLRDTAENIIGERAYRVLFAGISLPLALSTIVSFFIVVCFHISTNSKFSYKPCTKMRQMPESQVYFINHRYDGTQLWQLHSVAGMHQFVWLSNFISFFFLYPSTFNLLEVAAVDKPKLHLWETGIMRITRHPQV